MCQQISCLQWTPTKSLVQIFNGKKLSDPSCLIMISLVLSLILPLSTKCPSQSGFTLLIQLHTNTHRPAPQKRLTAAARMPPDPNPRTARTVSATPPVRQRWRRLSAAFSTVAAATARTTQSRGLWSGFRLHRAATITLLYVPRLGWSIARARALLVRSRSINLPFARAFCTQRVHPLRSARAHSSISFVCSCAAPASSRMLGHNKYTSKTRAAAFCVECFMFASVPTTYEGGLIII